MPRTVANRTLLSRRAVTAPNDHPARPRVRSGKAAAAAAGMSVRTARNWAQGRLPAATRAPRSWRTRADPFAAVWESEVVPLLGRDAAGVLEATSVLDVLAERWPERYHPEQLRTLQRPTLRVGAGCDSR